ncbi:ABC-type nickel/cobalt efflux system, permease component RcnA [Gemmobacter megaterium]|uniref:Nickel/cobalt efflux system n=1 Tax=Gemmobacter megaterium TaxID=1086013 RepID=A0A1N7LXD2_9RHOB|nr:hypothetical protein [Gemmobacter megaterium]GGE10173.1 hypothetical protein GCM10011345_15070 [Gemmobacter megaterium]SIS78371.1 ABC-type nickel/cobalt efflux system, permease component RcnA [Gemmobacter megaterium]
MSPGLTRWLGLSALAVVAGLLATWALGGFDALAAQGIAAQRGFRDSLAGSLRALRSGQAGAVWGLVALSFGYGVLHAAGPGHGKVLIGGYGAGGRVALVRLVGIALVASLAQATVAIVLVYGGLGLFGLTRDAIGAAGEGWMMVTGHLMMAAIGLWLVWRSLRALPRLPGRPMQAAGQTMHSHHGHDHHGHGHRDQPPHDHSHGHPPQDGTCAACGHRHGPTLDEVQAASTWREAAALVAGIAIRPCTGALMLLVLTWQLGLVWAGIAGAYAMGLGTALITTGVAVLSVTAREGALAGLPGLARARAALPFAGIVAGLVIAGAALVMLAKGV